MDFEQSSKPLISSVKTLMNMVEIKKTDLIDALIFNFEEHSYYVCIESGEVILYTDDEFEEHDIDDLENEEMYIPVEPIESDEKYQCMEEFISTLNNQKVATQLTEAINKNKPFRNFKNTISNYNEVEEQWFEYENKFYESYMSKWVQENMPNHVLV